MPFPEDLLQQAYDLVPKGVPKGNTPKGTA